MNVVNPDATPFERVGQRLRQLRLIQGVTRAEMARRLRSYGPIVSRVERGTHCGKAGQALSTVLAFCHALNVEPSEVLCVLDAAWVRRAKQEEACAAG